MFHDVQLLNSHLHPGLHVSQCGENWGDVFFERMTKLAETTGRGPLPVNEYARWLARTLVGQKIKVSISIG